MHTTVAGISGLRSLRNQLQEDAGDAFPNAVLPEILTLYDVCHTLELNIFQVREVLGNTALQGIQYRLNTPVTLADANDDVIEPG
ncbi:MAG: hypothetical protein AAF702_38060 [Chloroflexota bacterium]